MHAFSKNAYLRVQGRVPGRRRLGGGSLFELLLGLTLLGLIGGLGGAWVAASSRAFAGAQERSTAQRELDWVLGQLKRDASDSLRVTVFKEQGLAQTGAVQPLLRFEGAPTREHPHGVWIHYCLAPSEPQEATGAQELFLDKGLYRQLTAKGTPLSPGLLSDHTLISSGLRTCVFEEGDTPGLVRVTLAWPSAEGTSFFFLANELEEVEGAAFEELIP